MWVSRSLKAPDEGEWIALVSVDADGETAIIGYVSQADFEQVLQSGRRLGELWDGYLNRGEQNQESKP